MADKGDDKIKKEAKKKVTEEIASKTVDISDFMNKLLDREPVFDNHPIRYKIVELVQCMWKLTGLLKLTKDGTPIKGTCFLQRIYRKHDTEKEYAIMTFTTAYHLFAKKQDVNAANYEFPWQFSDMNSTVELSFDQNYHFTLGCFTLVESDKEYFCKNDWCAIECKYDDMERVREMEDCLDRYETLQKEIFGMSKEVIFEHVNLVIIVGYPKGRNKRISIGQYFHNYVLKEVRSSQRWCRYYYDAPTWTGNSGSPVDIFRQTITGFGYWFGHPHSHAKKLNKRDRKQLKVRSLDVGISSIGAERIE